MILAAIDPGLTGAIAMFDTANPSKVSLYKTPTKTININNVVVETERRTIQVVDSHELFMILCKANNVVFEKIVPYKHDSRASCFSFGGAFYSMLCSTTTLQTLYEVLPKAWKKTFNLLSTDKDCVLQRAIETSNNLTMFKLELPTGCSKHTKIAFCDAYLIGIHYLKSIGLLAIDEAIKKLIIV